MALAGLGLNTSYKGVQFSYWRIPSEGEHMGGLGGWLRVNNPTDPQLPQIALSRGVELSLGSKVSTINGWIFFLTFFTVKKTYL